MKGLSKDIEIAVQTVIDGLNYPIVLDEIEQEKLKTIVQAKVNSFKYGKELLLRWQNSFNAPSERTIKSYVQKLVKSGDSALKVLREALRQNIDYSTIDPTKHHLAIAAKPMIHQSIVELDAALIELRLQLSSENINLKEQEFKRGYPERFANGEMFPMSDYYKEWYCESKDAIMLDPKGTKGDVIKLGDIKVMLPAVPPKKDILFSDLPKSEQYWRRTPMPSGLNQESEDSYVEYIVEEFRRRREGIWFMNNGKPVYLTGTHYFAMQWVKMEDDGGYMNFRYAQRDMFYFTQACIVDPRCLGELFVKSRRTGFTYQILCQLLNDSTSTSNARIGMTSKSDEDAKMAFSKFKYGFLNLPFFFKPVVKGAEDSKNFLEFAKPPDRTKTAKKRKDTNTDDYLNSYIDYQPTKDSAYDGQKMYRYLGDEASKWERGANYENHWGQISPTFDNGGRIVGKALIGSTVNAMKKGGQEFYNLYMQSNAKKRDKVTGRTASGLYSYFLPAHKNMEQFTDKYGVCHESLNKWETFVNVHGEKISIGAVQFLEARRAAKKRESDIAYNEELRAFPMKIEEAFRDELKQALFNVEKIIQQLEYNEFAEEKNQLVRGNFMWSGGIKDTKVEWHPNENGRFLVSWIPPDHVANRNETKMGMFGGYSKHPSNDYGCFGCDPYDISGVVEGVRKDGSYNENTSRASKGSLHGVTSFSIGNIPSNAFFLEYIERPKTAEIFFEDVLMACVFYGLPILAENNKPRLLYHFKNRGYRGFVITRPDKASNRLSPTEKEIGGIPNNSEDVKQMHASAIEAYIEKYVGLNEETQEHGYMPFNRTLNDWKHFDISNRTKFDAAISSGLALMGVNRHLYKTEQERKVITVKLKTYGNK
jgi:hypothetical protein